MSIGATLRHGRESRGLTCEDVARATRIPLRLIAAMEGDEWSKLPGGIFTRGYLRAYAREVGLEAEPLVERYEAHHAPPPEPAVPPVPDVEPGEWRLVVKVPRWSVRPPAPWRRFAWPALAAAVLLVLYFSSDRIPPGGDPLADPGDAGAASSIGLGDDAPVGTAAPPGPTGTAGDIPLPAPGLETPLAMDIAVTRPCWIAMSVDGTRQVYRTLQPGDHERQQGREFVIRAGDAGALQLSLDGEAARPIGAPGEVVTLRITRDNYRSLLQDGAGLF